MSQQVISHSQDLKKLRDEGYEIEFKEGYLVVHHIPYVNTRKEIQYGKLITSLVLNNNITMRPDNHVMGFMGEYPCNTDGSVITAIEHANPNTHLFPDLEMNFTFSNKPPGGYNDYYEKVSRYADIICSPAKYLNPTVTAKTFKVITDIDDESVFNYVDTNSSRANIAEVNYKLNGLKIGIIGLGGTGSYVLDLVAKTPVREIHLFDGDDFLQHNAFRSPGAASIQTLNENKKKVDYLREIYSNMRKGIITYPEYVTDLNIHRLKELSFVFICIDKNDARAMIISKLLDFGISFIDVGFGLNIADKNLTGIVRTTAGTSGKNDHVFKRIGTAEIGENEYNTNIQVADLNALNATLAVIKWKKMFDFYQDLKEEYHSTYTINTAQLINEDFKA